MSDPTRCDVCGRTWRIVEADKPQASEIGMTDRIHSITITLDKDLRDDDCEALISACRQFRHVLDVSPNVADADTHVAEMRARRRMATEIQAAIGKALGQ